MTQYGYTLMCEQAQPKPLVRAASLAEQAGFDFAVISDHFHPWLDTEGSSPFAWSLLGAIAERTERIGLMTMVTCPFLRYHPAIVAQAAATIAILSDDRFVLGLGAGENLNEHVVGKGWPPPPVRHEMLEESVEIIRRLWAGGQRSFQGRHLTLDRARLYNAPDSPPEIAIAAGAPRAARLAATVGDALVTVEPSADLVWTYERAGGDGPRYGQVAVCWGEDRDKAVQTAIEYQRFAVTGWSVMAELPTPDSFAAATRTVREDDITQLIACGPDPEEHVAAINKFSEAGYDRIAVLQVGPDQEAFLDFYRNDLRPLLA
jgi:G6PDH family F420-dependent oxidoreductase